MPPETDTTNLDDLDPTAAAPADDGGADDDPGVVINDDEPNVELDDNGDPIQAAVEDDEEIEHDGKKYKLPKAVKPLLMFQQDYTKKTQEVAAQRQALETRSTELAQREQSFVAKSTQHAEAQDKLVDVRAEIKSQEQYVSALDTLIAQARAAGDTPQAQDLALQKIDLKEDIARLRGLEEEHKTALKSAEDELTKTVSANLQAAIQAGANQLAADKSVNLTKEVFSDVVSAIAPISGFTEQEVFQSLHDPRMFKFAKLFVDQSRELAKAKTELAAERKANKSDTARPAAQVGGSSAPTRVRTTDASGDRLSATEWAAAERARVAKLKVDNRKPNGQFRS